MCFFRLSSSSSFFFLLFFFGKHRTIFRCCCYSFCSAIIQLFILWARFNIGKSFTICVRQTEPACNFYSAHCVWDFFFLFFLVRYCCCFVFRYCYYARSFVTSSAFGRRCFDLFIFFVIFQRNCFFFSFILSFIVAQVACVRKIGDLEHNFISASNILVYFFLYRGIGIDVYKERNFISSV